MQVWGPEHEKDKDLLGQVQRRAQRCSAWRRDSSRESLEPLPELKEELEKRGKVTFCTGR